jgi:hypothetical protein
MALLFTRTAVAQEEPPATERLPTRYAERPLTLPRLVLAPSAALAIAHVESGPISETGVAVGAAASIGITDDLTLSAAPLALALSPKVEYAGPTLGATFRFVHGVVELGASATATLRTNDPTGVTLTPGIPLLVHLGRSARLDTGVAVPIATAKDQKPRAGLVVPVQLALQVADPVHLGFSTGVGMVLSDPGPSETLFVPLGVFAGVAIPGKDGPILDIAPTFAWNALFVPNATTDTVNFGVYTATLVLTAYLYL